MIDLRKPDQGSPHCVTFDSMCWPRPSARVGDIEWKMRYEPDELTRGDLLLASSVLNAYREIMTCSAKKRVAVVAGIRKCEKQLRKEKTGL